MPKKPVLNWVTGWSGAFATSVTLDKVINSFLASVFLPIKLKKHFCITGIKKLPNAYWLKTTETYSLTVHETKSPKSRCWQSWFFLRCLRDNLFHAVLLPSGNKKLVDMSFQSSLLTWHSPCVTVSVYKYPLVIRTVIWIPVTLGYDLILAWSSVKTLFPNKVIVTGTRD